MNQLDSLLKMRAVSACALLCLITAACNGVDRKSILGAPTVGAAPTVTAASPGGGSADVPTGSVISVTFSEAMAAATLTMADFSVECPAASSVAGSVAYDAATDVATFTPQTPLPPGTLCTATVTTGAQSSAGFALAANFIWSFTTVAAPEVLITVPLNGAANVPTNTGISATFTTDMNPSTVSSTTFTVTNLTLGAAVAGVVSYVASARTAVFTPTTPLAPNTHYAVLVTTGAADLAGDALATADGLTFTTGTLNDTTRPLVVLSLPLPNAAAVATNSKVSATFSKDMAAATIDGASFTLINSTLGSAVAATVTYDAASRTALLTPIAAGLAVNTLFTATVTTAATDTSGNRLAGNPALLPNASNYVWTFSTGAAADSAAPTITIVSPVNGAAGVCQTMSVSATFSKPMDPATINGATFGVTAGGVAVLGTVTYDAANQVAQFVAANAAGFAANTAFIATVKSGTAGVRDLSGNALAADTVWTFATGAAVCTQTVNLGSAAAFGGFGGSAGVTNQGINTVVNGNLASTAACTLITGFHDALNVYTQTPLNVGMVTGTIDCGPPAPGTTVSEAAAAQALADGVAAYNYLAALPPGSDPGAGQLGGLVLAPATYTAAGGSFDVTSGDLTLDAQGDPNAMWVFQTASALTVGLHATPRHVLLINGAQAKNVFWQVGAAARIEDGSAMIGTIISVAGITISTAGEAIQTTLTGRALSLVASVTMVNTTIIAP